MLSRRDLMGKIAATGAVLVAAGAARASLPPNGAPSLADVGTTTAPTEDVLPSAAIHTGPPATETATAPWELLRPLAMGSVVAHGWRVAGLSGAVNGSCVLTLKNDRGRAQRVHVCRNGGRPQGVVYTDHFDLVVMNGGEGDVPTDEGLARAVVKIARRLSANAVGHGEVVAMLVPHEERVRRLTGAGLR